MLYKRGVEHSPLLRVMTRPTLINPVSRLLKVIGTYTDLSTTYDCLLKIHINYRPISYHFWDKRHRNRKFLPPCIFNAPAEKFPLEFCNSGRDQKLGSCASQTVERVWRYVHSFGYYTRVCRSDIRTDVRYAKNNVCFNYLKYSYDSATLVGVGYSLCQMCLCPFSGFLLSLTWLYNLKSFLLGRMLVLVTAFLCLSDVATLLYFRCIIVHAIHFTEIKWWTISRFASC